MKNIKFKTGMLIVMALLFSATSCKKSFVDLTPQGIVPVQSYYASEVDIKSALNGIYSTLRPIYNTQWAFAELPSDNTQTFGESDSAWGEEDKLTWNSTSTNLQGAWSRAYATIAYCNLLLGHIGPVSMIQANKDSYIAQAEFIRSLMYFNLVRMFGGVPLILTEITSESQAYSYNRATTTAVYAQIEADLTDAASKLPVSYTGADIGRVTAIAAKALLGKVYLFENKFAQAEAKLAEIIPSAPTPLISYDQAFGVGHDNSSEIIFAVQYLTGGFGEGNSFASGFVPQPAGTSIVGISGGSFNIGTPDLNNAFEPGDLRKNISIGVFITGTFTYYYAKKFIYQGVPAGNEGDNDWPVIRWGDVLLMYAEAANENGNTFNALTQLNIVRSRAGLGSKLGLNQAVARTAIQAERRVELGFEGERWFDLIRWNQYVQVMQSYKNNNVPPTGAFGNILSTLNLYPIPSREISLNPNLTQNPGYN
ncbi:MAG: RagB/SusD family nutrient uptake outer membrane protein [Mucilaginibacter sp.]|uniref:RagB/SusD family nutrient uptake outer membrane protein n=1 Tax=Mucilaginibacter sp. TaxID=1882438 RepID=UPI00326704C8